MHFPWPCVDTAYDTGSNEDRIRSGRPKISTARDDQYLVRQSLADRKAKVPDQRDIWHGHRFAASKAGFTPRACGRFSMRFDYRQK